MSKFKYTLAECVASGKPLRNTRPIWYNLSALSKQQCIILTSSPSHHEIFNYIDLCMHNHIHQVAKLSHCNAIN